MFDFLKGRKYKRELEQLQKKLDNIELTKEEIKYLDLKDELENLEKKMIVEAVQKYGSVNKAAVALGLSQPALWKKCKKLDIQ